MFQPSVAIVICIFLQGTVSQASDVQDKVLEPLWTEKQCNGYCFSVLKSILDHFVSLKEGAYTSNELRDKIHSLEDTVKDLQSQFENTKTQLKDKENLISDKEQRIHELQDQLNSTTARFSEISDQLNTSNELRDKMHSLEDTVKDLENTKTQLKDKENLISEKDQRIHELQVQLNFTTARFSEIRDQLTTCNQTDLNLPNTCPSGSPNGIYQIKLRGTTPFKVPCVSSKSGWTVVLRRINGSENFNRTWNDYRDGFGDLSGEFFIGLEKLHLMTQSQRHELYIQLEDFNGSALFASYDNFIVGREGEDYELKSLGKYSGTAGDSLGLHSKHKFSTFDRDNDTGLGNCAVLFGGGWWYTNCATSSLTGKYHKDQRPKDYGILWGHRSDYDFSLTFAQMMIRPTTIEV